MSEVVHLKLFSRSPERQRNRTPGVVYRRQITLCSVYVNRFEGRLTGDWNTVSCKNCQKVRYRDVRGLP